MEVIEHTTFESRMDFVTAWIMLTGWQLPWPQRGRVSYKGARS